MEIPIYDENVILEAIEEEGLAKCAYGYKASLSLQKVWKMMKFGRNFQHH